MVLGETTADMADALATAETWAGGEEPSLDEYVRLYGVLAKDEAGEAVYWTLAAAYEATDEDESVYCLQHALATLGVLPGWSSEVVWALHASLLAPRDTIPADAPECQEAA
ncbi:hypothetical protein WMF38_56880 [Sorangium sp. So ce118]